MPLAWAGRLSLLTANSAFLPHVGMRKQPLNEKKSMKGKGERERESKIDGGRERGWRMKLPPPLYETLVFKIYVHDIFGPVSLTQSAICFVLLSPSQSDCFHP